MRVFITAIIGAILGLALPLLLCAVASVIVGGADGTGRASADAHTILAVGPILALIGLFVGGFWGIARARKRSRIPTQR